MAPDQSYTQVSGQWCPHTTTLCHSQGKICQFFFQSYHSFLSATVDFNMSEAKSLETGESLMAVRGYGSHVSCLCSTCGGVPSGALCSPSVFCRCHGWLCSDSCSAAECMCYGHVQMWMCFFFFNCIQHLKRRRM